MKKLVRTFLIALAIMFFAGITSTITAEAACKHSYKVTKTVKATCKKAGYKKYKCKKCGKKKKTTIKKKSHSYKLKKTVKAKCIETGYKQYKCKKCKATKKTTLKKLGHNYKSTKTVKATCAKAGYKNAKCSRCKATKKVTLAKIGHTWEYFEEQGHYENVQVLIEGAWTEYKGVYVDKAVCDGCNADITSDPWEHLESQMLAGNTACGSFDWIPEYVQTEIIEHDAIYETQNQWVVDVNAHYKCKCNAIKY